MPKIINPKITAPIKTISGLNLISDFELSEKDNNPRAELGPLTSDFTFPHFI